MFVEYVADICINKEQHCNKRMTLKALIEYISAMLDLKKVDMSDIENSSFSIEKNNFLYSEGNQNQISISNGRWSLFKIKRNSKSEIFYKEYLVQEDSYLWVVFEEKTQYYNTNSQLLFQALNILQGISEYDFKEKTVNYYNYIEHCRRFLEKKELLETCIK